MMSLTYCFRSYGRLRTATTSLYKILKIGILFTSGVDLPMRVILLGAPGAGKGTQAEAITHHFNIPKIATGDMLRKAIADKTELGQLAKSYMDQGQLVPDSVVIGLVKERLAAGDCKNGYLFDGFPRTLPQAQALVENGVEIDYAIYLEVPDEEIIKRLSGRRMHLASGRTYHVVYNPPREKDKDDLTGEPLVQRDDDKEETIKARLAVYQEQTKPVIDFYKNMPSVGFHVIDGTQKIEEVCKAIESTIVE